MLRALTKSSIYPKKNPDKLIDLDEHEFVIQITDEKVGLRAYVAIHTTLPGPAHGGTRMAHYTSESEAIIDVLNLSKAMSYKSALANLPYGGAKGVIVVSSNNFDRKKLLISYAKKIDAMKGLFRTGTDVGLNDKDVATMSKYSNCILGLPKHHGKRYSTSEAAAKGVFYAIQSAAKYRYGSENLNGKSVAVKGVGKLGGELVRLLLDAGSRVIVSDIDQGRLSFITQKYDGVEACDPDEIHKKAVNIYSPCALGNEFSARVIRELNCDIIAGGANNQLLNDKAGDKLFKNNILYVPDYIANAGGLIFVSEDLEKDGYNVERMEKRLKRIKDTVTMIISRSIETGEPTHRVANKIARERLRKSSG